MSIELDTPDQLEYRFYPVSGGQFSFKVRAANDAHIALTSGPSESDPMIEVFIGGWSNSKSVIRKNRTKPDVAEASTPDVLNAGEFRGFWVRWYDGVYTVGCEGDAAAFLSWQDPSPFPINFAGVCTGWGATGSWRIDASPAGNVGGWQAPVGGGCGGGQCWVPSNAGQIPPGALVGGQDGADTLYVARARHEGALIPGKLVPSHQVTYIAWGGAEHAYSDYEVLCGNGNWLPTSGNAIPPNAVPGGETEEGEPLFIGRVMHEGAFAIGKVQPSHSCVYISYGGAEIAYPDYEVLVN